MGIKYDGLKLTWLKQYGSNQTTIAWISPPAGDVGTFVGGGQIFLRSTVAVINGPAPAFSITSGSLPTGLNLDPNTGMVSGIVENDASSYEYTLRATSGNVNAERTFTANVTANEAPEWITNAGSLGSQYDNTQVDLQLEAEDPEGQPVTFTLVGGSLPLGLRMSNTGAISGLLAPVTDDTTFFFTLAASDGVLSTQRAFNFTTQLAVAPVWQTASGLLGNPTEGFNYNTTVVATSTSSLTYSLASGALPDGLALDGNTGVISGMLNAVAKDTTSIFTIRASDGIKGSNRQFSILVRKNVPPVWVTSGTIGQDFGGKFFTRNLIAGDPNGNPITYSLANGSSLPGSLSLNSLGTIAGELPDVGTSTTFNFAAVASDGLLSAQRTFSITVLKNEAPVWDTPAELTPALEEMVFARVLSAHDPAGVQTITYSFAGGQLPVGVDVYANGVVRGTPDSVLVDTDYVFTVEANNGVLSSTREFTLPVEKNVSPIWTSNSGLINTVQGLSKYSYNLSGYDPNDTIPVFTLFSGALPTGLSLATSGVISGTVGNVANSTQFDFTVSLSDGFNPPVNRAFAITVTPNELPVWNTNSGVIGSAFETAPLTVQISGYDPEGAQVKYYLVEGNELPTGMYLNGTTGVITGTIPGVAQDTNFSFNIWVDDGTFMNARRVSRNFTIVGKFNSPPTWQTASNLGNEVESLNYSKQLSATGVGNGPMIYTLESGSLPPGLTMSQAGLISGTLPVAATDTEYEFEVKAYNGIKSANRTFTITVMHNLPPVWNSNAGTIGSYYANNNFSVQLSATDPNGKGVTYALTNATTLPSGVTMSNAGLVSGSMAIVTNATTYNFTVRATDSVLSADRSFSLTTLAQASPTWVTPAGEIGATYKNTYYNGYVKATDPENQQITYSIVSGALPNGLTLNPNSGLIAGITPSVNNDTTYNFTIRASDGTNTTDRAFSFLVQAVVTPSWVTPAGSLGSVISGYSLYFTMTASDPQSLPLTYSLISGTLPPNVTFFTGNPSCFIRTPENGNVPVSESDNTYTFTIEVTNGFASVQRTFSVEVTKNLVPVWVSPASGSLGADNESAHVEVTYVATDPENQGIYFTVNSGAMPNGLTLNPNTGVMAGNLGSVSNTTTFNWVIDANDGRRRTPRSFSYITQFSSPPAWSTPAGSLGTQLEQTQFTANVAAAAGGQPIVYSVSNASVLPSGLSLNANTGAITGMLPPVSSDTSYSFDLIATSTLTNKATPRTFSINVINDLPPVWSTPAGSLIADLAGTSFNKMLLAVDPNGTKVTYSIANGSLPGGITFDPNATSTQASISGTLPAVVNNTTYSITIGAADGASQVNRTFTLTSQLDEAPVWTTNAGSLGAAVTEQSAYSFTLVAVDPNGHPVTYALVNGSTLPGTLTVNAVTGALSGTLPVANANAQIQDVYNFDVRAADDGVLYTDRSFFITVKADQVPTWTTPQGSIGSVLEGQTFNYQLVASDPEGKTLTYTLTNSSVLPTGMTLYANGVVRGRPSSTQQDTTYPFWVRASDGLKTADREFSVTVQFDSTYYDPYSNAISVLMNFEEAANSTAITDWFGHTVNNTGDATISTDHAQYGNSAVRFIGTAGALSIPAGSDLNFTNQNAYTVEFWMYPLDVNTTSYLISKNAVSGDSNSNNRFWGVQKSNAGVQLRFGPGSTGSDPANIGTVVANQWYHIAVVKNGLNVKTFFNGTQVANQFQNIINTAEYDIVLGHGFNGYMDDLRITNAARYTGSFTPGPAPKPPVWITAANTIVISGDEGTTISNAIALEITDQSTRNARYYNVVGNAISGVILDTANGTFSGTVPETISANYTLTAQGKDGNNNLTSVRNFAIRSNALTAPSSLRYSFRYNNPIGSPTTAPTIGNATSITLGGNQTLAQSQAPSPYGTSTALEFVNTSGYQFSHGTNMSFLAGDSWTIELWVYGAALNNAGGNRSILSIGGAASLPGNSLRFYNNGTALVAYVYSTHVIPFNATNGAWNHLALVRNGSTITPYTNGVAGTPTSAVSSPAATYFDGSLTAINGFVNDIGTYAYSSLYMRGLNMWSIPKYTQNFTPAWTDYLQPIWSSTNSVLGTGFETAPFNATVTAQSFGGSAITYSVANSGSLPAGVTLASNGYIYGAIPAYNANAPTTSISLVGTDAYNRTTPSRVYTLTSMPAVPTWVSNGAIALAPAGASARQQLEVIDPAGFTLTYTLQSGSLPGGLTLNSNGVLTGVLANVTTDTVSTFTVNAVNTANKYGVSNTLTYTVTTGVDEYFANVGVLLHADGTYTDSSGSGLTWTNSSTANVNTIASKWGSGSLQFFPPHVAPVINSYVRSSTLSTRYALGTRDFTIEMWVNPDTFPPYTGTNYANVNGAGAVLLSYGQPNGGNLRNTLSCTMTGNATTITGISMGSYSSTQSNVPQFGFGNTIPISAPVGQWHHVAYTRQNGIFYLYFNGVQVGSLNSQTTLSLFHNTSYVFNLSGLTSTPGWESPFCGRMDDVRITLDRARYTGDFTPPNRAFPTMPNPTPVWVTNSVTVIANSAVSNQLVANSPIAGRSLVYTLANGTLANGTTLYSNGMISGYTDDVLEITNSVITVKAEDSQIPAYAANQVITYSVTPNFDPYINNVVILMPMTGTPGSTPTDVRGQSVNVVTNGSNAGRISNAVSKWGDGSAYFAVATNNYLQVGNSTTMPSISMAGDFTVEAWVYPTTFNAVNMIFTAYTNGVQASNANFYLDGTGKPVIGLASSSPPAGTVGAVVNQWNHVVWCRSGNTTRAFINGVQSLSTTSYPYVFGASPPNTSFGIGHYNGTPSASYGLIGYMNDLRVTKDVARYTANFTPPTGPLPKRINPTPVWTGNAVTVFTNSVVNAPLPASSPVGNALTYSLISGSLANGTTLNSNGVITGITEANASTSVFTVRAADANTPAYATNQTITMNVITDQYWSNVVTLISGTGTAGTVPTDARGRPIGAYSDLNTVGGGAAIQATQSKWGGGAVAVNGNAASHASGYLAVGNSTTFANDQFGTGDFTVEAWIYPSNWTGTGYNIMFGAYPNGGIGTSTIFCANAAGNLFTYTPSGAVGVSTIAAPAGTWSHVAWSRQSGTLRTYVNGVLGSTASFTTNISAGTRYTIGNYDASPAGGYGFQGYLNDIRLTKGVARYTGNSFVVPSGPFPSV